MLMEDSLKAVIPLVIFIVLIWAIKNKFGSGVSNPDAKSPYAYKHKDFLMSHAESSFFKKLEDAVGEKYYIFPQVHLSSIVDQKVVGQNWKAALSHIDRKSVDFVLCDKINCKPLLAIELDDYSHEREDRIIRDTEVERILQQAHLPLLRFKDGSDYVEVIRSKVLIL